MRNKCHSLEFEEELFPGFIDEQNTDRQKLAFIKVYLNTQAVTGPGKKKARTPSLEYHCDIPYQFYYHIKCCEGRLMVQVQGKEKSIK